MPDIRRLATSRSSLENCSQRRASFAVRSGSFIHSYPFTKCGVEHGSYNRASTPDLIVGGYNNILAERKISKRPPDLDRRKTLVLNVSHHNEQIHVARSIGCAPSVGTEEHYARRLEFTYNAIYHRRYYRFGRHRAFSHPRLEVNTRNKYNLDTVSFHRFEDPRSRNGHSEGPISPRKCRTVLSLANG